MASPIRIGYLNRTDGNTVTASTSAAGFPVDNLKTPDIQERWRATASPANVILDMGQSLAVHCVALMRCNLVDPGTFRVRVSTSDPTGVGSLVHDSGTITAPASLRFKKLIYIVDSAAIGRYVRIDLTQTSPLPEAGRLFAGRFWTPPSNMQYGWAPLWRDFSRRTNSISQQATFVYEQQTQRGVQFRLTHLSTTEARDEIAEINRRNGTKLDLLVCLDRFSQDLDQDSLWGLLEQTIPYPQPLPLKFDALFNVWERL